MRNAGLGWNLASAMPNACAFIDGLSAQDRFTCETLITSSGYPSDTTLFVEQQAPEKVLFLREGRVKLSMNSSAGKRVILDVANRGESLGFAAAFSGSLYEFTAETISPCTVAGIRCKDFLEFLRMSPSAHANVSRELCLECSRAYDKVRRLGLTLTASAKLVRFLLEKCSLPQQTDHGTRVLCALTHSEIGECIGVSRETVTRLFSDFKCRELMQLRGSVLIISDRRALEAYAGIN